MQNEVERIIRDVGMMLTGVVDDDRIRQITGIVGVALRGCRIERECTDLSTEFSITNDEYIKHFVALKTVKGCSKRTLKYYKDTMTKFFMAVNKPVPTVETNDIRAYLAIRDRRDGVSKTTQNNELMVIRSFFATMLAEEYVHKNPTAKIEKIKTKKKQKEPYSEMEMERLRAACRRPIEAAIVEVLYSTGCRVGELIGMNVDDRDEDKVLVHGKGGKDRWVYLTPRATIALEKYLATRTDTKEAMFVGTIKSKRTVSDRITDSSVEQMVRSIGKRAGVQGVHPHRFRRTTATMALRRGMPIDQVSKLLGHEQISTTQIYAITDLQELERNHGKYIL